MTSPLKKDVYQSVTDNIVAMLERGVKPWAPQWSKSADGLMSLPLRSNGEAYRGLNLMLLWGSAEANGFRAQTWMTFNQAKALGGCVRKGEKGVRIVFVSMMCHVSLFAVPRISSTSMITARC